MTRNICITSADGQTGHLTAELLLTYDTFRTKFNNLICLAADPTKCSDLESNGAKIFPLDAPASELKKAKVDTIFLIPPASKDKVEIVKSAIATAKKAGVQNVVLLSSAGADMADPQDQPRLREFIDMEQMCLEQKGIPDSELAHSPCVIRAGFYAENLLLYTEEAQAQGKLPLPIGPNHKFAPVALGDVALLAANILISSGPHGLSDNVRGQLIVLTGPMLAAGEELATAASDGGGAKLKYEDISEDEAMKLLSKHPEVDDSEKEYLLEYYGLVREGRMNYISTIAFNAVTGQSPMAPEEFFKTYAAEFQKRKKRRIH